VPSWLVEIGKQLKVAPLSIDRLTVVATSTSTTEPLWIIQSAKLFTKADTARIVAANLPDAEEIKIDGKTLHVSSKTNRAIYVDMHGLPPTSLVATGTREALKALLTRPRGKAFDAPSFLDTLSQKG